MSNHRKPKYSDPSEEAKRIRNLPPERIRTPASKFAGRGMTETPIVTAEVISKLAKKIESSDYYQRLDGVKTLEELAEKGADVSGAKSVLEAATEDYSPHIRHAAEEALKKIKEVQARKKMTDIYNTDPVITVDGKVFDLQDALMDEKARSKAVDKFRIMAQKGVGRRQYDIKSSILRQIDRIIDNKGLMGGLGRYTRNHIDQIIYELSNDSSPGIKSMARMIRKKMDSA